MKMRLIMLTAVLTPLLMCNTLCAQDERPCIQVALLLDTSNSMDGLIEQARTRLWDVVNQFARMSKNGVKPALAVALYEYGNDNLPSAQGYIRLVCPFTDNLDRVSEQLFALNTNGGSEYCGQVIKRAVEELAWSRSARDLKVIFIAGNEPFSQGDVDYREACRRAIAKGIIVNTIFCGPREEGIRTGWKDGADLADGKYAFIDQNQAVEHIEAPQDAELGRLSDSLNRTYIAFGDGGPTGQARQAEQDKNASMASPAVAAQRALSKASAFYSNSEWDLVDAVRESKVKIESLKPSDLPKEMRTMDAKQREEYILAKAQERKRIQAMITALAEERSRFIAQERQRRAQKDVGATLDEAMIKAVKDQAAARGFQMD